VIEVQPGRKTSGEDTAARSGAGRYWMAVNRLCEVCCGACLILIAGFTLYEIVCRYVFDSPTQWTQDFSIYLMIWCTFLGLMPTDLAGQHIRIDVWYKRLSASAQARLEVFVYIAMAGFAAARTRCRKQLGERKQPSECKRCASKISRQCHACR
jgi:hypothetical protein